MSACNRLDLPTLGSQPVIMPKNLPSRSLAWRNASVTWARTQSVARIPLRVLQEFPIVLRFPLVPDDDLRQLVVIPRRGSSSPSRSQSSQQEDFRHVFLGSGLFGNVREQTFPGVRGRTSRSILYCNMLSLNNLSQFGNLS